MHQLPRHASNKELHLTVHSHSYLKKHYTPGAQETEFTDDEESYQQRTLCPFLFSCPEQNTLYQEAMSTENYSANLILEGKD